MRTENFLQQLFMPQSVSTQFKALPLKLAPLANGQSKVIFNTDSIDIWFAMLWKDMEVPLKVQPEQKPCGKENFDGKWMMNL